MRTFLEQHLKVSRKNKDIQTEAILIGILEAYNHYYPINNSQIEIEGWHGRSSF